MRPPGVQLDKLDLEAIMGFILDAQLFHGLYRWLNQPILTPVMSWLTHLGDSQVVLSITLVGILESALKRAKAGRAPLLPWLGILAAIGFTQWLKEVVNRPRPGEFIPQLGLFAHEMGRSFPSGHATLAFALATALSFRLPRLGWWWMALAASVGLTRIGLGLHWPSDVAIGALIGISAVALFGWAEKRLSLRNR